MKNSCCLFLILLFVILPFSISSLTSCASSGIQQSKQKELAMANQRVGEEQYRNGNYTAALKSLLEAQKTLKDDPYLYNSLGLVYLAKNRTDLAEKHFKQALSIKPDYSRTRNNLGGVYMKQKKWALAIQTFEAVVSDLLYATPEMPLSNLGWIYYEQGLLKEAARYFNQALDIRPDFIYAVHGLASVYIQQHQYSKATAFIHDTLEKDPGIAVLHADRARIYQALGNYTKAKEAWNVVLKLVLPRSPLAKEARKGLSDLN